MPKKKVSFILGIRPDIIRAALILKYLKQSPDIETELIWSGQHYSDNLKDIFFRELNIDRPDVELGCGGATDAEISSSLIVKLYNYFAQSPTDLAIFLGDTNTTTGAIACAQLNIPIFHIEGCMRSYDWQMPEEKYRTMIDHISDIIYAYFDEYKENGIREGLNPNSIVVVGNPIVDILNEFYFSKREKFDKMATPEFFNSRGLVQKDYFIMTCHRRENVHSQLAMENILNLVAATSKKVFFPASYRTQKILKESSFQIPSNLIIVDPVGYDELICLMANSLGAITDSGTIVEETCVLGVPSLQMRKSTERPQVYDVQSSVKFDPRIKHQNFADYFKKLDLISQKKWDHKLGDGKSSEKIAKDIIARAQNESFGRHQRENYHIPTERSYRDDGVKI